MLVLCSAVPGALDLIFSSAPKDAGAPRCPLWSRGRVRVSGCEGTQRGQQGGQGGLGKRSPLPLPASPLAWAGNSGVLAMLFFYHRVNKARNIFVTQKLWVPRVSWDRGGSFWGGWGQCSGFLSPRAGLSGLRWHKLGRSGGALFGREGWAGAVFPGKKRSKPDQLPCFFEEGAYC